MLQVGPHDLSLRHGSNMGACELGRRQLSCKHPRLILG